MILGQEIRGPLSSQDAVWIKALAKGSTPQPPPGYAAMKQSNASPMRQSNGTPLYYAKTP